MVSLALSMPRTPTGHKRPADVISNAVQVMKIATGEATDDHALLRNDAAVALGKLGGTARAKKLSAAKRKAIAKRAAQARWAPQRGRPK